MSKTPSGSRHFPGGGSLRGNLPRTKFSHRLEARNTGATNPTHPISPGQPLPTSRVGFKLPTGPAKPAGSGIGIPDRFGQKSVEAKFEFKILCANGSYQYTGQFDWFIGRFDW